MSSLTTVAQCDAALVNKNSSRGRLTVRISDQKSRAVANATAATVLPGRMAELEAEIAGKQAEISNAEDQLTVVQLQIELNSLENERLRIILRTQAFAGEELVERQFYIGKMEHEVDALDELIAALEVRKAELLAGEGQAAA